MLKISSMLTSFLMTLLFLGCVHNQTSDQQPEIAQATIKLIESAINDPLRSEESRARDANRKPADILEFSKINIGDKIIEIAPAGGYYTALLSRVVGDSGKIYAVDPERIFEHFPNGREVFPKFISTDPRNNVEYSSQLLDEINVPEKVDQVWMVLYYHDTVWTNENRIKMNRALYDMLKPGGEYIFIDHNALPGADESVTKSLHRMDTAIAKAEIEVTGFFLDETSSLLANPDDPKNISVFSPEIRGKTDRTVWRFVKPASK